MLGVACERLDVRDTLDHALQAGGSPRFVQHDVEHLALAIEQFSAPAQARGSSVYQALVCSFTKCSPTR